VVQSCGVSSSLFGEDNIFSWLVFIVEVSQKKHGKVLSFGSLQSVGILKTGLGAHLKI